VVSVALACAACSFKAPAPWLYPVATVVMMVVPLVVFGGFMWWVRRNVA
jgi:hypothetical protein